ncbi:MAG: CehA/McbA family metallohydrolase [Deltaproteobacteria bacterium]|nr:CehA/McbA family metallohydrolase [Deltaproteobacteria bacterium]
MSVALRRVLLAVSVLVAAGMLAYAVWPHGRGALIVDAPPPIDAPPRSTTTLVVRVTDRGVPVAARVLLYANEAPLRMGSIDIWGERQGGAACEIAPDVVGSWDGLILGRGVGEVPVGVDPCIPSPAIPYGIYKVMAWRGIEYELWYGTVDLSANRGRVELSIALDRAWTPHGTLAADLHVHARASDDSHVPNPQRVVAQAAAGVQVIALSDHNTNGDLADDIAALKLQDVVTSLPSNELSADLLHAGVYPVTVDRNKPNNGSPSTEALNAASYDEFFKMARELVPDGIVQLNHPRLRSAALFDATEWDGIKWPPPFPLSFDAIEVIAGHTSFNVPSDRRLDECVRDYYTLVDHGFVVAPLGNSDTHDLNWILDGSARTYVYVDEPRTKPFDRDAFVTAIKRRRVVATNGPWLDVEVSPAKGEPAVGPGGSVQANGTAWLDITVEQTLFVRPEKLRITIGGKTGPELVQTIDVPRQRTFRWSGSIELPKRDTWIGVTVDGDRPLPREVTGSYHYDRKRSVTPFAIVSPILVDADGDRRWRRGRFVVPLP